ncbi:protein of unknown function DUF58 [Catenulispora acidiphila DSM 44928]|uniref:DUF58 domain-containing protein n=1 Tax=Catenulispora acidiphila (strain DSM 44928 / JCM 14897 / NBRC 102108 / NRRL B-24433 / ID139908) TaxID=479433 RepID=C7QDE0_CATAD|nr:DUF58 domain-containing protein [Catenulispora acidiphila]ACU72733.1 protein of unknown function DUF58 [Catenulispora acidiphila DSM 44928]
MTRSGVAVAFAAALLGVLGAVSRYRELLLLAIGCATTLAIAIAWAASKRTNLVATSEYAPARPEDGQLVEATVHVRNHGRRTSRPMVAVEQVGADAYGLEIPELAAAQKHDGTYTFVAPRRGQLTVSRAPAANTDPIGLVRRTELDGQDTQIRVYPRWHSGIAPILGPDARVGRGTVGVPRGEYDFHSLRDYEPGDPLRLIHWRATAKRGEPLVRRLEVPDEAEQLIVLDNSALSLNAEDFEHAVRVAASLAVAARRAGLALELRTVCGPAVARLRRTGRSASATAAMELLCDVEQMPLKQGPDLAAVLAGLGRGRADVARRGAAFRSENAGPVVLGVVTGFLSTRTATALSRARQRFEAAYVVQVGEKVPVTRVKDVECVRIKTSEDLVGQWKRLVRG